MASSTIRAYVRTGQSSSPQNPPRNLPSIRPLLEGVVGHGKPFSIAQRASCLILTVEGFLGRDIERKTGIKPSTQTYIKKKAFKRGFRPDQDPQILDFYVQDGARSGRPKEVTTEIEHAVLESVRANRAGREKSSEVLAYEQGISASSVLRLLYKHGLSNVKPTRKPGLNAQQRQARL
jgi:transposase